MGKMRRGAVACQHDTTSFDKGLGQTRAAGAARARRARIAGGTYHAERRSHAPGAARLCRAPAHCTPRRPARNCERRRTHAPHAGAAWVGRERGKRNVSLGLRRQECGAQGNHIGHSTVMVRVTTEPSSAMAFTSPVFERSGRRTKNGKPDIAACSHNLSSRTTGERNPLHGTEGGSWHTTGRGPLPQRPMQEPVDHPPRHHGGCRPSRSRGA